MRTAGSLVLAVAFMGRVEAAPRRSDKSAPCRRCLRPALLWISSIVTAGLR